MQRSQRSQAFPQDHGLGLVARQRSDQMILTTSMLKMMVVIMITKLRRVLIMKMWVMISPMTMMILSARCEISDNNEDNVVMRMMVTQMILSASYQMRNI